MEHKPFSVFIPDNRSGPGFGRIHVVDVLADRQAILEIAKNTGPTPMFLIEVTRWIEQRLIHQGEVRTTGWLCNPAAVMILMVQLIYMPGEVTHTNKDNLPGKLPAEFITMLTALAREQDAVI